MIVDAKFKLGSNCWVCENKYESMKVIDVRTIYVHGVRRFLWMLTFAGFRALDLGGICCGKKGVLLEMNKLVMGFVLLFMGCWHPTGWFRPTYPCFAPF